MIKFTKSEIKNIKDIFAGKKIAIIGDMMLDGYYWGDVKKISPEAPVPVVEIEDEFFRFGGAANVALNINALGGIPYPIGVIGDDQEGKIFTGLINNNNIIDDGIVITDKRPTTVKIRVIANSQHLVRIDKELKDYLNPEIESLILNRFNEIIDETDAVILQDYNKGVLSRKVIESIIGTAKNKNKIVNVDPKFLNFFAYNNVDVFKPNKKETEDALNIRIVDDTDIEKAGELIIQKLGAQNILLTLGSKGTALFDRNGGILRIPTRARKVADVSGAGDTVIATLTMAMSAGFSVEKSAYLANFAGGLVCEEMGIVPIELDHFINELTEEYK
ncbi:MAG: D-glycero-beta-D-manno-heptose-7-phosphate kinase [Melioribacteraceae bacterium]|nr:D-glycero-beta-D-manno-heptose-7-phosphate kinase [Melioribacteraceae bacterium]